MRGADVGAKYLHTDPFLVNAWKVVQAPSANLCYLRWFVYVTADAHER